MKERMINGYSVRKVTYQTLPIAYRIQKESFKQLFEHYQDTETSLIWKLVVFVVCGCFFFCFVFFCCFGVVFFFGGFWYENFL